MPRRRCLLAALLPFALVSGPSPANAQPRDRDTPSSHVQITLADGATATQRVDDDALRVGERDVTQASCRSCVGRHITYAIDVQIEHGAVARIAFDADVVGRHREFTTGWGPYPAVSTVRVWLRDGTELELHGRVQLDVGRRGATTDTVEVTTSREDAPVRAIRFVLRRPPT